MRRAHTNTGDSEFADLAAAFAKKELAENREAHDRYPFAPLWTGVIEKAMKVGFFGITAPAGSGGLGMDTPALATVLRELSCADASLAALIFTHAAGHGIIAAASTDGDCKKLYRELAANREPLLSYHSFAHPDEIDMPLAEKNGDAFLLSGTAAFMPLGAIAGYAVIPARSSGDEGFSYFLVGMKSPGVRAGEVFSIGLHACPAADVVMDRAAGTLIGAQGKGMEYYRHLLPRMSVPAAAISLGIMEGSFDEARRYAEDRFQGGRQIIDWPGVRMLLAGMASEIEAGSASLAEAARMMKASEHGWEQAATAAALNTGEASCRAAVDGVQVLGGNGYMKDYGQEKRMRDAYQARLLLGMPALREMDFIAGIVDEGI